MLRIGNLAAILLLCMLTQNLNAETLHGKVVAVADGDTVVLLDEAKQQIKIRLAHIDAPEKKQAFGKASKQALAKMLFAQEVSAEVIDTDRYGRKVARVFVQDRDVNKAQLESGMAWVYRKYASDPAYFAAEQRARKAGKGLWADNNPVPPWAFRRCKGVVHKWLNLNECWQALF